MRITAVTPLTFMNPASVTGLTDSAGNLTNDISWYDNTTRNIYVKPAAGSPVVNADAASTLLHLVSSESYMPITASYLTIEGINVQNAVVGLQVRLAGRRRPAREPHRERGARHSDRRPRRDHPGQFH